MDKDMYLAYDEWKRKHPDDVGNGSWFAFRAGWQAAKSAQKSMHPTSETLRGLLASLTPEQLSALEVLLTPLTCG